MCALSDSARSCGLRSASVSSQLNVKADLQVAELPHIVNVERLVWDWSLSKYVNPMLLCN